MKFRILSRYKKIKEDMPLFSGFLYLQGMRSLRGLLLMIYMSLKMPNAGKTAIFNLGGQRLSAPQKGLNIINGRKVIIK